MRRRPEPGLVAWMVRSQAARLSPGRPPRRVQVEFHIVCEAKDIARYVFCPGDQERAHMGADTFIRVGSCGVFQPDQKPGDVIIASGTLRAGGTANAYLPPNFPAVPTFSVLRALVQASAGLNVPYRVGVGGAGDAFYAPRDPAWRQTLVQAGVVSVEMESDTLFVVGGYRGWGARAPGAPAA